MTRRQAAAKSEPVRPAAKALAVGDRVLLLGGSSKGAVGTIVARWRDYGAGIPAWRIDLPDAPDRVIRADFLEKVT